MRTTIGRAFMGARRLDLVRAAIRRDHGCPSALSLALIEGDERGALEEIEAFSRDSSHHLLVSFPEILLVAAVDGGSERAIRMLESLASRPRPPDSSPPPAPEEIELERAVDACERARVWLALTGDGVPR